MGAQHRNQLPGQSLYGSCMPKLKPLVTATIVHPLYTEGTLLFVGQDKAQHRREPSALLQNNATKLGVE